MSGSLYGMSGMGSNGMGLSGGSSLNNPSLLAMLMANQGSSQGAGGNAGISPLSGLIQANHTGGMNPVTQQQTMPIQNLSANNGGAQNMSQLATMLSALKGNNGLGTGQYGLSPSALGMSTGNMANLLSSSPYSMGAGQAMSATPQAAGGSSLGSLLNSNNPGVFSWLKSLFGGGSGS